MVTFEKLNTKNTPQEILYGSYKSPFGLSFIGIAKDKICHISFLENKKQDKERIQEIQKNFPEAKLLEDTKEIASYGEKIFTPKSKASLRLLLKGTDFQIKVWKALMKIPTGKTSTYLKIAQQTGSPKAARAAGTACGKNSIAYLIPCHRVLTSNNKIGGYRWGAKIKEAILEWEQENS